MLLPLMERSIVALCGGIWNLQMPVFFNMVKEAARNPANLTALAYGL